MLLLAAVIMTLYGVGASAYVLPPAGRIVGGVEASIEEIPYSASLQLRTSASTYELTCGASILSEVFLLTAAFCKPPSEGFNELWGRVGSSSPTSGGQLFIVVASTEHWEYNVGILQTSEKLQLGPAVLPVVLPTSPHDDPQENELVTASGWGHTDESPLQVLRKVDLPTWSNEKCDSVYGFITASHICLGGTPQGGTAACMADFGGPATYNGVQVGIMLGGLTCGAPNVPVIYLRVSSVVHWIEQVTQMQ